MNPIIQEIRDAGHISIPESLFGLTLERSVELGDMVTEVLKAHGTDEAVEMTDDVAREYWKGIYQEIIVEGKTENERMWITFTFSSQYTKHILRHELADNGDVLQGLVKRIIERIKNDNHG